MPVTKKILHLVNLSPDSHDVDDKLFLPKEVFRRIIDRERDRANRTGEIFSLVVFVLPDNVEIQETLTILSNALSTRMRSIDASGWLDRLHVGILLPETDSSGSGLFVQKIYQEKSLHQLSVKYEIFTYPSDQLTDPEKIILHMVSGNAEQKGNQVSFCSQLHFTKSKKHVNYMFCLTKRILKRVFDILVATACLLFFSPLFLAISLLIKAVSPGPVFYKQKRIGFAGQPFTFLKFRTMRHNADNQNHKDYLATLIKGGADESGSDMPMHKLDHDPQIIPFGNLMRKSCVDEFPQLINVLRGDMSLVGPRPPIPYEVKEYLPWHRGRFNALPGMTGLWQVSGKNKLSFKDMVRLDIRYTRERSLWLDVKILFKTPMAIFAQLSSGLKTKKSTIEEGA